MPRPNKRRRPLVQQPHPLACYACLGRGCDQCEGRGLACPECHGRRIVRGRVCFMCCEGNQVHPIREQVAIHAALIRQAARHKRRPITG